MLSPQFHHLHNRLRTHTATRSDPDNLPVENSAVCNCDNVFNVRFLSLISVSITSPSRSHVSADVEIVVSSRFIESLNANISTCPVDPYARCNQILVRV